MRKKVMKIYALFLLVLAIGIGVQSCCSKEDYKICGMTFYVNSYQSDRDSIYMYNLNTEDGIDTSYDNFGFIVSGRVIEVKNECAFKIPFVTACYAFQKCPPHITDSIPRANIRLSLDRDIVVDNHTITAGTNLMNDPTVSQYIQYNYDLYFDYQGRIFADSADFSKFNLDTGYYQVKLTATTVLGQQHTFDRKLLFKR